MVIGRIASELERLLRSTSMPKAQCQLTAASASDTDVVASTVSNWRLSFSEHLDATTSLRRLEVRRLDDT